MAEVWIWLEEQGAHDDVVSWARPYADRWEEAWTECPRGDWLLAIAARAGVSNRRIVKAACDCARFALDYLPEGELRPGAAIDAAAGWAESPEETAATGPKWSALEAQVGAVIDTAPDPAVAAAATAALACLRAVDAPEEAPLVVTSAVQAALLDVGDCAMMSAVAYAQSACAERVRAHIGHTSLQANLST